MNDLIVTVHCFHLHLQLLNSKSVTSYDSESEDFIGLSGTAAVHC